MRQKQRGQYRKCIENKRYPRSVDDISILCYSRISSASVYNESCAKYKYFLIEK